MGFYNLVASDSASQESLPGANSISSEGYDGYYFTNKSLYWSTSITLSTGTYGIYLSNISDKALEFSINHPTKLINNKTSYVEASSSIEQYVDGDSQTITLKIDSSELNWSTISTTFTTNTQINDVAYGNGIWVIVGDGGRVASSTDGITWTSRSIGFTANIEVLEYGNGIFVAGTSIGGIRTSTDAITWTLRTGPFNTSFTNIKYVNNLFLGSYLGTGFTRSTDGVTWTSTNILYTSGMFGISYGAGVYVAGGGVASATAGIFRYSTNGLNWTTVANINGFLPRSIEFANNEFYAVGFSTSGIMAKSTNGITWTTLINNSIMFTSSLNFIKYLEDQKIFVAGGIREAAISSTDGISWKESFAYTTSSENAAYGNGDAIIVGYGYGIKSSLKNKNTYVQISRIEGV